MNAMCAPAFPRVVLPGAGLRRLGAVLWAAVRALRPAQAELKHLEGFLAGVEKKLGNKRFVEGAPAAVVELERKKKADAETKIAVLKETLKSLGA